MKYRELYVAANDFARVIEHEDRRVGVFSEYLPKPRKDFSRVIYSPSFRRLQGKSQLFPANDGDPFYRNRLTHSIEVSNICVSIAAFLNHRNEEMLKRSWRINYDIAALAGLAHDLGHPPFGHNGEAALNDKMERFGGFEGNGQTLRILTTLETRIPSSLKISDFRRTSELMARSAGLNLTFRSLASVLKYDKMVNVPSDRLPHINKKKGYYKSDETLINALKNSIYQNNYPAGNAPLLNTIECQIMDLADDIAYSTFDLEDCFQSGITHPLDFLSSASPDQMSSIVKEVRAGLVKRGINDEIDERDVLAVFVTVFEQLFIPSEGSAYDFSSSGERAIFAAFSYDDGHELRSKTHLRREFSMRLLERYIGAIKVVPNDDEPALSKIELDPYLVFQIECLKAFNYIMVIESQPMRATEHRGREIITQLFDAFDKNPKIMPEDVQYRLGQLIEIGDLADSEEIKSRTICDFIAGMTDVYAAKFFNRIKGTSEKALFDLRPYS